MKKSLVLGFLIVSLIANIILVRTTLLYKNELDKTEIDKHVFKVYPFEGEDKNIRISDGYVIISPNKQVVDGGEIQYIGSTQENIQSYSKTIYLDKKGDKHVVLSNSVSFEGDTKGTVFPDEFLLNKSIGQISSKTLFSEDDINILKGNLFFSLDYLTVDGQSGNYTVKLKVKEFNLDETD